MKLTQERLRELLDYNPETGIFRWRKDMRRGGIKAGSIAGRVRAKDGRCEIWVQGRLYIAARLAWLYVYGEWPNLDVEHRDVDSTNNRISNLRLATRSQNNGNVPARARNKSGYKGVHWGKSHGKWVAMIQFQHKHKNLGLFDRIEDAAAAYQTAARELFGEFARFE